MITTEELAKAIDPAFPCVPGAVYQGMTLRDYFAAKAMQGLLANPEYSQAGNHRNLREGIYATDDQEDCIVEAAYTYADAMLAERAK